MSAQGLAIVSATRAPGMDGVLVLVDKAGRVMVARTEDYSDGYVVGRVALVADGEPEAFHALTIEHNPGFKMTASTHARWRETLKRAALAVRLLPMRKDVTS